MLTRLYSSLISKRLKEDILIYSNAKNIISAALIAIIMVPLFSLVYYFLHYPLGSYIVLLLGFCIFLSVVILKYYGALLISGGLFVAALFLCLTFLSFTLGGLISPATFWLLLPPFLAIKFGALKSAFFWGCLSIITVVILFIFQYLQIPLPPSQVSNEILLWVISVSGLVIVFFLLAYFFELGKREATYELELAKEKSDFLLEKAQESMRAKNEFLGNLSHEVRTPLNAIIGYSQLLEDKVNIEDKEFLSYILSSAKALTQMFDSMLDISKLEFGKMKFHPMRVDLRKLVRDICNLYNQKTSEKNIQLTVKIAPEIKDVLLDPLRLRQVLYHFISNAIKFTAKNGKVEIRIFYFNNELKIEVEDTGIGIDEKDIHKLFHPFQQLDASITKKYQGTGVGLALVRRIVERQNGRVGVISVLGKGSIFYAILPTKLIP